MKGKIIRTAILLFFSAFLLYAQEDTESSPAWNIAELDTARNVTYLSSVEKDVILYTNMARSNPSQFAEDFIKPRLSCYDGKLLKFPGGKIFMTSEGVKAAQECYEVLMKASPLGILIPDPGLSLAAMDHVIDQGSAGTIGHDGTDKSTPTSRIRRYGSSFKKIAENIMYGMDTGEEIVIQLLIDDNVPDRGHRKNILQADLTQAGVAIGPHKNYVIMCVIEYADGFVLKPDLEEQIKALSGRKNN
ncbi:CAP domain-containing protein [Brucepastera parasyntrophica]|uniref:CAP domain-containing protein n=1 Tax=Brucepastera parasyntrophica TaxID=2880008 RepID=UPI00210BF332|nr:CAP domain-containing protein [Brucepastera parasyntrophica]ULQ59591.1 CAP domain-containing protein [Brucepastera parasyntrophica]